MCAIFDFWWNNFLMGMKFNFKFEIWEIFTKDFHVKKVNVGILCKMNSNQNCMEFFCKSFCWRSLVNLVVSEVKVKVKWKWKWSESEEFFCPRFRWKLAQLKFKINKCAQFSSFLILQKKCGKKSDSSLKIRKKFTKDFHVKKKLHGNPL